MDNYTENNISPLELLNIYLIDGKSKGDKSKTLYKKFNWELSWDAILNKGYQKDLAPLIYHIVKNNNLHLDNIVVSHETKNKLKPIYYHYLAQNLNQFNELEKILDVFETNGIDVIQLKGAELAKNYYPDESLRPMVDIDLLVRTKDMKRAKGFLMNEGYKFSGNSDFDEELYEKKHFHIPYMKHFTSITIMVELHQDIASNSDAVNHNINEFWNNSLSEGNERTHVFSVAREYLLLHLIWHTYLNISTTLFIRIISLIDVALVINKHKDEIDWHLIEQKSEEWGIKRQVYYCFYLIDQLFDNCLNSTYMQALMPSYLSLKLFRFIMINIGNSRQALQDPNRIFITLLNLLALNTNYKRLKYIVKYSIDNVLRKKDWMKERYSIKSNKIIWFYYIIHPIILCLSCVKWMYKIYFTNRNAVKATI